ncbi:uncharacterized protein E0L32_007893 [Thyridium curvatum]|uniref:Flavin-containing monooxygenase n=1 Tax=Thyridium curvatum TaxID=1093900 RepID=A0A507AYE2_9PEZI|nr:uncharacterized protein E0L32_007893 [Thyridium curvatum]TPX11474.1 hypothetical protein E0L32_007893 [Thyridium curvatum]
MWAPTKASSATNGVKKSLAPYEFDPSDPYNFSRRAVDQLRPMKVIVLGGGMSGIITGIFFPREIENLELTIYDKNPDLGGTWFESRGPFDRYPGVACDVPSHAYQFTFESNPKWSRYWASGPEIQEYLKSVAKKYGADKYMKFNHTAEKAEWDEAKGKWTVTFTKTDTNEADSLPSFQVVTDTADAVVQAVGALNKWKMPDIKGLDKFKGKLMHSAHYDTSFDATGKRVALIGGGSSGIQILPQLQAVAARVDHYMKGKTWIPPFGLGAAGVLNRNGDPNTPQEELDQWRDPERYLEYRRKIESSLHEASDVLWKDTPSAIGFQKMCEDHMRAKLAKKPEIFEALCPTFAPACRRLTPGPGYLEALVEDNVEFIPTQIQEFVEDGIITEDGKKREVDAIICATGFAGYKQHFPVIGKNGINLQDQWENNIPESYVGIVPENMPNFFVMLGPNGGPGVGSTVPFLESVAKYAIMCIQKLQREWYKSMTVKAAVIKDFGEYTDEYLEPTVFNSSCRSWWRHKGDGRILALWPGSALHGIYVWSHPRWEDYEYVLKDELKGPPVRAGGP